MSARDELVKVLGALSIETSRLDELAESSLCVIHSGLETAGTDALAILPLIRSQVRTAAHRFKVVKVELARVINEVEREDDERTRREVDR